MNSVTIRIEGEEMKYISNPITLTERKDEQFDSANITQLYSSRKDPYYPGKSVVITINGQDFPFLVENDAVTVASRIPLLYRHEITLIEPTMKLQKIPMEAMAFVNSSETKFTLKSALERIRDTCPLALNDNRNTTRLFEVAEGFVDGEIPEMDLPAGSLFDNLVKLFSSVRNQEAMPYFDGKEISQSFFNQLGNKIVNVDNIVDFSSEQSYQEFVNRFETFLSNATPNQPLKEGEFIFLPVQMEKAIVDLSETEIVLQHRIGKIQKVEMQVTHYDAGEENLAMREGIWDNATKSFNKDSQYTWDDFKKGYFIEGLSGSGEHIKTGKLLDQTLFDITEYCVEEDIFRSLSNEISNNVSIEDKVNKGTRIYYKLGENRIKNLHTLYYDASFWGKLFDVKTTAVEYIRDHLYIKATSIDSKFLNFRSTSTAFGIKDITFRITYQPIVKSRIRLENEELEDETMIISESESISYFDSIASQMKNLLKRSGKADKVYSRIFRTVDEVNHVGDYLEEDGKTFVLTNCQVVVFPDFVIALERYNESYNKRSSYVGIEQKIRSTDIPLQGVERMLHYDEYVYVCSAEKEFFNDSMITDDYLSFFLSNLAGKEKREVANAIVRTYYGVELSRFNIPVTTLAVGNSVYSTFRLQSQTIAVNLLQQQDGKWLANTPVIYTNEEGKALHLSFELYAARIFDSKDVIFNLNEGIDFANNDLGTFPLMSKIEEDPLLYVQANYNGLPFISIPITHPQSKDRYFRAWMGNANKKIASKASAEIVNTFSTPNKTLDFSLNNITSENIKFLNQHVYKMTAEKKLYVDKTASEILSMHYQIHFLAGDDGIYIGENFGKYVYRPNNEEKLQLYCGYKKFHPGSFNKDTWSIQPFQWVVQAGKSISISYARANWYPTIVLVDSKNEVVLAVSCNSQNSKVTTISTGVITIKRCETRINFYQTAKKISR